MRDAVLALGEIALGFLAAVRDV